jgi:NADPH:quinone reductase-like Zn-dependent oxidoreductase
MKACRVHRFGPPESIVLDDVPIPAPAPGDVLVRVAPAGVGPWDGWIRAGKSVLPQPLPLTLGSDLAGVVETVGPGGAGVAPGDAVFGVTNERFTGAYAEYAIAARGMIAAKPAGLDDVEAAAVPVVAVTAWQMLFERAHVTAGQTVLVHGAGGSVGAPAVQMAHDAGARVVATAGRDDLAYVRELGADVVCDYRADRFEDHARDVDVVLDNVGGETLARSFAVLKRGGTLVSIVAEPDAAEAARRGVQASFLLVGVTTAHLERIAKLIAAGRVRTRIGAVLPLAEARAAHEMLEGTRPRPSGKIVLRVGA